MAIDWDTPAPQRLRLAPEEARQSDEWMDRLRADFHDDQKVALLLTRLDQLPDPPLWFRIRFFFADTWFRIHNRKTGS